MVVSQDMKDEKKLFRVQRNRASVSQNRGSKKTASPAC